MKAAIAELEAEVRALDEQSRALTVRREKMVAALNGLRELDEEMPTVSVSSVPVQRLAVVRGGKKAPKSAHHPRGERVKTPAAKKRGPGGSRSHVDEATWARARKAAETEGAYAAAQIAGVSSERIRQVAKKQGWTILKLKGGHRQKKAPAKSYARNMPDIVLDTPSRRKKEREQEDNPMRRCECGALTRTDPCGNCQRPWSDVMKASFA